MPYTDPIKWAPDHASPKERSFDDHAHTQVESFHPEMFSREYTFKPPQWMLNAQFLYASMAQFKFEEMMQSLMDNYAEFIPKTDKFYHVS